jgi:hypothetical protein
MPTGAHDKEFLVQVPNHGGQQHPKVALKFRMNANVYFFKLTLPLSNPQKYLKKAHLQKLTLH